MKYSIVAQIVFILVVISGFEMNAQTIQGKVIDHKSQEALSFVNIVVENTNIGTVTDLDGNFSLKVNTLPSRLQFSFMGYKSDAQLVKSVKKTLIVKLKEDVMQLDEVVLRADYSYDKVMLKKVISHKEQNNPDNIVNLNYSNYARTSAFLANVDRKALDRSKYINFEDSLLIAQNDSMVMIPFFMDETLSHNYRAEDSTAVDLLVEENEGVFDEVNDQIKKVLNENLTTEFNFYDNQIQIMGRGFPSPISNVSSLYYKVYVTDSVSNEIGKQYKYDFYPKSYRSTTFKGSFWVDSSSWALTEFQASLPNSANLNFVSDFEVFVSYQKTDSGKWIYNNQKLSFKLTLVKEGKNKTRRKSFHLQKVNVYNELTDNHNRKGLFTQNTFGVSTDSLLLNQRLIVPLDTFEMSAYRGIKGLKEKPVFKFVDKFSAMTLTGYYNMNKFDMGPYFALYRRNAIEGSRVSIPLRTSKKMNENFMLGGLVGYGFKNKRFAWNASAAYKIKSTRPTHIKLKYHTDYFDLTRNKFIEFIKENPYQQGNGNVFSTLMLKKPNPFMLRNNKLSFEYECLLNNRFGLLIRTAHNSYFSNKNIPFERSGSRYEYFTTKTILADIRYSLSQEYDEGFFSRIYYGNQKPVFHLSALVGAYKFEDKGVSNYYSHLNFSVKNRFNYGPILIRLLLESGAIIGDVPFPLLHLTRGSRDFGSARYYFNLLHHASFVSDIYTNTHIAINGGGVLFDKLPLIRELNLREIVAFKAFYGKLLGNHSHKLIMRDYLHTPLDKPYMELSLGLTNIFKCLRIEYVRRLNTHKAYTNFSSPHGLKFRLEVSF